MPPPPFDAERALEPELSPGAAGPGPLDSPRAAAGRLPPLLVRMLVLADLGLGAFPPWAWWLLLRWTGRRFGLREFSALWLRGVWFCVLHAVHALRGESGLGIVRWTATPVRRAPLPERADHSPRGSCGSCHNCCQTYWRPEGKRVTCPLRDASGCLAYGGVWWDYFNCGSYPEQPRDIATYGCPRFEAGRVPTAQLSLGRR